MNTEVVLLSPVCGSCFERAAEQVQRVFAEIETCLSRFGTTSELSALNRSAGARFSASPLLFDAVLLALTAARATDGLVDPTVLNALESAGYDRSFEQLDRRTGIDRTVVPRLPNYRNVACDPADKTIRLLDGCTLDLGGIGKGLAVDRALAETSVLPDRCVVAGGDGAARGTAGDGQQWVCALEDTGCLGARSVAIHDAAFATSSTLKRTWQAHGQTQHHLIDPRTGRSSTSPLRSVTVIAGSCVQADIAAKAALLLGEQGMSFLESRQMHGFGVRNDESTVQTMQWPVAAA